MGVKMDIDKSIKFEQWLTTMISDINHVIQYANLKEDQLQLLKDRVYIMQLVLNNYHDIEDANAITVNIE